MMAFHRGSRGELIISLVMSVVAYYPTIKNEDWSLGSLQDSLLSGGGQEAKWEFE